MRNTVKRTLHNAVCVKPTLGALAGRLIDWMLCNWFRLLCLAGAGYLLYSTHVFVNRFLVFTSYIYDSMEEHNKLPEAPSGGAGTKS